MLPNVPAMLDAHFGIPMAGAVINALNVRLEAETIAYILDHGEAKVLLTDPEYAGVIEAALAQAERRPLVVDVPDPVFDVPGERLGELTYDELLAEGDPDFEPLYPADEWQAIALGYTSGTTGPAQGRRHPSPRRLPERDRRHPGLGHGAAPDLPLDAADVPLQRLVLPVGGRAAGRAPRSACAGSSRRRSTPRSPSTR